MSLAENDRSNDGSYLIRLPESHVATWKFIRSECPGIARNIITEYNKVDGCIPYEHGYIYLLHATGTNYFKIGKSNNPDRRYLEIAPKMPFETKFAKIWKTQFMSLAERRLHDYYSDHRVNGEWFEFSDPELLRDLILSSGGINAAYAEEWCDRVFDWGGSALRDERWKLRRFEASKTTETFTLSSCDLLDANMMAAAGLSGISIGIIQSIYDAIYAEIENPIPEDIQEIIAEAEPTPFSEADTPHNNGGEFNA